MNIQSDAQRIKNPYLFLNNESASHQRAAFTSEWQKIILAKLEKGPDGLIWSDQIESYAQYEVLDGKYAQFWGMEVCKAFGGSLPDIEDFNQGHTYGFLEVLPNIKGKALWTAAQDYMRSHESYVYAGDMDPVVIGLNWDNDLELVHCVSK
jgi:hypothetical protein